MIDALRIIAAKSEMAGGEAMQAIRAVQVKSPVAQTRYNRVVELAFHDHGAQFTQEERQLIASYVGDGEQPEIKAYDVRVRVTADEKAEIQEMAQAEGMNVSDFIRSKIGL
jgi:hypothetical protein